MQFWERVKASIRSENTTQEWVARKCGISSNTFRGWISKGVMPGADKALEIARAVNRPLEWLIAGDAPANDGPGLVLPNRYQQIMQDLQVLTDDQLAMVAVQVRALADIARADTARNAR